MTSLKKLFKEHGFRPSKSMGQNFLVEKNIRDNILNSLSIAKNDVVVEIGPGFGMMTFEIAKRCGKVYAVEKDRKIASIMAPQFEQAGNIELINEDILKIDYRTLMPEGKKLIVYGNIPYNITTGIIEEIIDRKECIQKAAFVMQNEYAERLLASAGSKTYGSISCFVQYHTRPRRVLKIKRNCFNPVPKVDSCLLIMDILESPEVKVKNEAQMFKIIRQAFSQRRKKAINPLSHKGFLNLGKTDWETILKKCELAPDVRAEDIPLEKYALLSNTIQ